MFHELIKDKHKMDDEAVVSLISKAEYGVLSTIGENGYCYGVPLNHVLHNNTLYFHCALGVGHKLENIRNHKKVSYTIVDNVMVLPEKMDTRYESIILFGNCSEVEDIEEKKLALELLVKRFSPELYKKGMGCIENGALRTGILKLEIEHSVGKSSYL